MKTFSTGVAIALLIAACSLAAAQESANKNAEKAAEQRTIRQEKRAEKAKDRERGKTTHADKAVTEYFAGKMMLMDQSTIELAKMAEQRSSNPQVKQFAKMLVDEHTKCRQKLEKRAPEVVALTDLNNAAISKTAGYHGAENDDKEADAIDNPAKAAKDPARNKDGTERLVGNGPVDPDGVDAHSRMHGNAMNPTHRILAIDRQATNNYIQSTTEMLAKFDGNDFDMGFLGFTIGSHTWALSELKAMSSVGDEEFQKLISDATVKTEQHLIKAQELSKEFEKAFAQRGNAPQPTATVGQAPVPK